MRPEIYLVTNAANGKRYVGVTTQGYLFRWKQHCYTAMRSARTYFHRAIIKYGPDSFVVELVGVALDASAGSAFERELIKQHQPEYNQTNGGEFTTGKKHTAEVRAKMSASAMGRKNDPARIEAHAKRIKTMLAADPEYRAKVLSALEKGRANIDRAKQKAAAAQVCRTRKYSEEERRKCVERLKAVVADPVIRAKIAKKKSKPVECVTLNTVFNSVLEAASATGVYFSNISEVCRGRRKTAGGLVFQFA